MIADISILLLHQYDRIDPSDVQALRDEIDDLQIDIRKFEEAQAVHTKEMEEKNKLVSFDIIHFRKIPYRSVSWKVQRRH